jgi:hypothetical protein
MMSKQIFRNPGFRYGMPMVIFSVASYYWMGKLAQSTIDARDFRVVKKTEREANMEQVHAELYAKLNVDEFKIKPIDKKTYDD